MKNLNENLGNVINFSKSVGATAPTDKQIKTLKGLIYSYKITVKDTPEMNTKIGVSRKISEIYGAINKGQVQKRTDIPKNCKVMRLNGIWKLIQVGDLNDKEHEDSGFASFVSKELATNE